MRVNVVHSTGSLGKGSRQDNEPRRRLESPSAAAWSQAREARSGAGHLASTNIGFETLRDGVRSEFRAWSTDGETSSVKTKSIGSSFGRFCAELRRLRGDLAAKDAKLADRLLKNVTNATMQLARAIKELEESLAAGRIRVVWYHTDCPKQNLKIRQAMAEINTNAAERLEGREVDSWCEWPGLRPEDDPRRVTAVAKLVLLSQDKNQFYE